MTSSIELLSAAIDAGHADRVEEVLSRDPSLVSYVHELGDGETPLHWAARLDNGAAVGLLVDHGSDVNARDRLGRTPLLLAIEVGAPEAARALLAKDADLQHRDMDGYTPFFLAARGFSARQVAVLGVLFQERGSHLDILTAVRLGMTAYARGMLMKQPELLKAEPHTKDALAYAVESGDIELVNLLLDHGTDPNDSEYEPLPLIAALSSACGAAHLPLLELLLKHNADPYRSNTGFPSPYESARSLRQELGRKEVLQLFKQSGVKKLGKSRPSREKPRRSGDRSD